MSNALGMVLLEVLVPLAKAQGAVVMVDGAQSVPHLPVDVQALDIDFLAFSAHKMLDPRASASCGKMALLDAMDPFLGGGDMILSVSFEKTVYNALPYKLEAGTPAIAEAVGLGAAVAYL